MCKTITMTALLFDGGPASSVTGPIESFYAAAMLSNKPLPKVNIITQDNQPVTIIGGAKVYPTCDIDEVTNTDILIVGSIGFPNKNGKYCTPELSGWLNRISLIADKVISICTGTFVVAQSGLLNNKVATTHWAFRNQFREQFSNIQLIPERKVTNDGKFYCTSGTYAHGEVMMHVVEDYYGQTARSLCSDFIFGSEHSIPQDYLSNFVSYRQHSDILIHKLQDWLHSELYSSFSISDLAEKIYLSERQMKRRFKIATGQSPINYIQQIRMSIAKEELERTNKTIEDISRSVGYEDVKYFRTLFKKYVGGTPMEYRLQFKI